MPVIEVTNLHKRYRDQVAVHDVSFTVDQGEIFGILGPNGAGKTTTVESIAGLRRPDGGRISVFGLDPQRDRAELRQRVGRQLQESELPEKMTVREAATRLFISEATVKTHLLHIYAKLGVKDRAAAVAAALERGLIKPGSR
jgi:ABC-2 type transport system ATP-binding protein